MSAASTGAWNTTLGISTISEGTWADPTPAVDKEWARVQPVSRLGFRSILSPSRFPAAGTRSGVGGPGVQGYRSTKVQTVLDGWTPNEPRGGRAGVFAPGFVEVWEDAVSFVVRHESISPAQREHPNVSCVHFSGARGSAASGAASIRFCKEGWRARLRSLGRFFGLPSPRSRTPTFTVRTPAPLAQCGPSRPVARGTAGSELAP